MKATERGPWDRGRVSASRRVRRLCVPPTPFPALFGYNTSRASLFQRAGRFPEDPALRFPTRSDVVQRSIIENNAERVSSTIQLFSSSLRAVPRVNARACVCVCTARRIFSLFVYADRAKVYRAKYRYSRAIRYVGCINASIQRRIRVYLS